MSLIKTLGLGVLCAGVTAGAATVAGAESYEIDPNHVSVNFMVEHLGFSKIIGRFNAVSGTIEFDEANPALGRVEMVLDSASVDTNHQQRDDHLRSPDFFNTGEFPEISFSSTAIEVTGDNTATITGDFTLLGVTKPLAMEVTFNKIGSYPFVEGQIRIGFSGRGRLMRSEFGMTYALDGIGDAIDLMVEVEAAR